MLNGAYVDALEDSGEMLVFIYKDMSDYITRIRLTARSEILGILKKVLKGESWGKRDIFLYECVVEQLFDRITIGINAAFLDKSNKGSSPVQSLTESAMKKSANTHLEETLDSVS